MMKSAMRRIGPAVAVLGLMACAAGQAPAAITLTFDDVTPGDIAGIHEGYGDFNWEHLYVMDGEQVYPNNQSGFKNGRISGDYVAYNVSEQDVTITSATPGETFLFNSVYLTAAWNNGLSIQVRGFDDQGIAAYDRTVVVNTTAPTLFTFNYENITSLMFSSFGGTDAEYGFYGTHFAMDNITFNAPILDPAAVPEPTTLAGGLFGVMLAGGAWLRRRRAAP